MARVRLRTVGVLLGACLVPLSATACSDDDRQILVIYSPHGRDLLRHFEGAFELANPGTDVEWIDMGSQEILDRIRSERANPQADIWWGAPSEMYDFAAADGLLEPYTPGWADAVEASSRDPGGMWIGTYLTPEVIAYNTEVVPLDSVPRTWDAVLEPRWRDQVLIRDPLASGTMRTVFSAILYREYARTGDPEAGYEWLLRLDAQTKEYVLNPTLLYLKLARREGLVTLWNMPDIEILRATTDFPIDYLLPEDGTPIVVDAIAVVQGSRHPELARRFIEFVGSEPNMRLAAERFFRIPARSDIPIETLPEWIVEALPRIRPMEVDRDVVREYVSEWLLHWDREIRGRGAAAGY